MSNRQKKPGETINESLGCVRPEGKWPNSVLGSGGGGGGDGGGGGGDYDDDDDDA